MSDNPEMVTNAKQLRERFAARAALYADRAIGAKLMYEETGTQYAKHVYAMNSYTLCAVIACYGDVTNMTFKQAQVALGIADEILERSL